MSNLMEATVQFKFPLHRCAKWQTQLGITTPGRFLERGKHFLLLCINLRAQALTDNPIVILKYMHLYTHNEMQNKSNGHEYEEDIGSE